MEIQDGLNGHLGKKLIRDDEYEYLMNLFEDESRSANGGSIQRYEFTLPGHRRFAAVADYDVLDTPRQRLGGLFLKEAEVKTVKDVSGRYKKSTRVMYYEA
jgi:hypothetical protein